MDALKITPSAPIPVKSAESDLDSLIVCFYQRLHKSARFALSEHRGHESIQATELVNELYCHFRSHSNVSYSSCGEFFALASSKLRQILYDRYRWKTAKKRDYGIRVNSEVMDQQEINASLFDFVMLNTTIDKLEKIDPVAARLVELKVYWGLSDPEASEVLEVSESTVYRRWTWVKAWLLKAYKT